MQLEKKSLINANMFKIKNKQYFIASFTDSTLGVYDEKFNLIKYVSLPIDRIVGFDF